MSNNAVVMCTLCLGCMMIIFGLLEIAVWVLCFEFCLVEGSTGGNYYLGIVSGLSAILVGITGIAYLCLLHSYIVVISLIFNIPLVLLSIISLIISVVNTSEEVANSGAGVAYLIAQIVFCSLIAVVSIILALQFCCIQNKNFKEEGEEQEKQAPVRQGPERFNPYVDDDARALPNNGFAMQDVYRVSHPSTPGGRNDVPGNRHRAAPRGGHAFNSTARPARSHDHVGRTASVYLGRRSPREPPDGQQGRPNDRMGDAGGSAGTLNSLQLGPILGNFDARADRRGGSSDNGNRAGDEAGSLPDFNEDQLDQDNARYGDNSNYFF